jgi:hypothetical protein
MDTLRTPIADLLPRLAREWVGRKLEQVCCRDLLRRLEHPCPQINGHACPYYAIPGRPPWDVFRPTRSRAQNQVLTAIWGKNDGTLAQSVRGLDSFRELDFGGLSVSHRRYSQSNSESVQVSPARNCQITKVMAEGEGFEPPVRFPVHRFSRPTVSTTHTSLRMDGSHWP